MMDEYVEPHFINDQLRQRSSEVTQNVCFCNKNKRVKTPHEKY